MIVIWKTKKAVIHGIPKNGPKLYKEKIEKSNPRIQNVKNPSSATPYFSLTRKTKI